MVGGVYKNPVNMAGFPAAGDPSGLEAGVPSRMTGGLGGSPQNGERPTGAVVIRQKTLKSPIGCTGIGLHSGAKVTMTLHPAPADHGIVFRRTDLAGGGQLIPADWRHVVETRFCTALAVGDGPRISTVEHLMAALAGSEIDNALVDVSGPEVPVMDGSAAPFVFLIECAGVVEQPAARRALQIRRRVAIDDGERSGSLTPGNGWTINVEIDFESPLIRRQELFFPVHEGSFKRDISRARTFALDSQIGQLKAAGLARGGSLDNAVVISGHRVLNGDGLRYDDEFVRHKILDCLGDLYLAGGPIMGHFRGLRSGHTLNNQLLHKLFTTPDAYRWVAMTEPMESAVPFVAGRAAGGRAVAGR